MPKNSGNLRVKGKRAQQPLEFLTVGRVVRPHGVRGALLIEPSSDLLAGLNLDSMLYFGAAHKPAQLQSIRFRQKRIILFIEGCGDRNTAEIFRNQNVFISIKDLPPLPENVFFHWQILGLDVISDEGEKLGQVTKIIETGANDVYIVRNQSNQEILLPAIKSVILKIDPPAGTITVHILPGLRP